MKLVFRLFGAAVFLFAISIQAQSESPSPPPARAEVMEADVAPAPTPVPAPTPNTMDELIDALLKTPADWAERIVFFPAGSGLFESPALSTPWVIYLLVGSGVLFTLRLGFINIRGFPVALRTVRGKYSRPSPIREKFHISRR